MADEDKNELEEVVEKINTHASRHPTLHKTWEWLKIIFGGGAAVVLLIYSFKMYAKVQDMDEMISDIDKLEKAAGIIEEMSKDVVQLEKSIIAHNQTIRSAMVQNEWLKKQLELTKAQSDRSEMRSVMSQEILKEWVIPLLRDIVSNGKIKPREVAQVSSPESSEPDGGSDIIAEIKEKAVQAMLPEDRVVKPKDKVDEIVEDLERTDPYRNWDRIMDHENAAAVVFDERHKRMLQQVEQQMQQQQQQKK